MPARREARLAGCAGRLVACVEIDAVQSPVTEACRPRGVEGESQRVGWARDAPRECDDTPQIARVQPRAQLGEVESTVEGEIRHDSARLRQVSLQRHARRSGSELEVVDGHVERGRHAKTRLGGPELR